MATRDIGGRHSRTQPTQCGERSPGDRGARPCLGAGSDLAGGCACFFQSDDGIRIRDVTGVQTCALPIWRHLNLKVAFVPLLIGSYSPDMMTKWFVYGIHLGPWDLKASDPAQFHRGWPGFGFTHSLIYGVAIGLILWKVFDSKLWAVSFLIGQWAHALTDTGDTVGTMLLFPWTFHFHLDAWAYAGQTGRMTDAAAYFSGLGSMWDAVWIVYGLISWRVVTGAYFDSYIYRADAFWPWA